MQDYILDGNNFINKDASYEYIREVFDLPEYQGKNLDALWDSLSDLSDIRIFILNARTIVRNLEAYGLKLLDLFGDLDKEEGYIVAIKW